MLKRPVLWKAVKCKSAAGHHYYAELPDIIDRQYRGTLLSSILAMPKKIPIRFEDAIQEIKDRHMNSKIGHEFGQCFWFLSHFVEWISSEGYHIELTGDEFEPYAMSDRIV